MPANVSRSEMPARGIGSELSGQVERPMRSAQPDSPRQGLGPPLAVAAGLLALALVVIGCRDTSSDDAGTRQSTPEQTARLTPHRNAQGSVPLPATTVETLAIPDSEPRSPIAAAPRGLASDQPKAPAKKPAGAERTRKPVVGPAPAVSKEEPPGQALAFAPTASTGSALLPVPTPVRQLEIAAVLKDVYKIGDARTAAQKLALAKKLLDLSKTDLVQPEEAFVLLETARGLAGDGGDPLLALETVDAQAARFEIAALAAKKDALEAFAQSATDAARIEALLRGTRRVIDQAEAAERIDVAFKLATLAYRICQRSEGKPYRQEANDLRLAIQERYQLEQATFEALAVLKGRPEDPVANDCVGRWYCVVKGEWHQGLTHLAKSSDAALRSLAQEDLAQAPDQPQAMLQLADRWWLCSKRQGEDDRRRLALLRAGHWYERAHPQMPAGLLKIRVEERLAEIASTERPGGDTRISPPEIRAGLLLLLTFEPDTFEQNEESLRVLDRSGHERHGEVLGAKPVASGRAGAALALDGKDDSVELPALREALVAGLESLTISVWVRQASSGVRGFLFDVGAHPGQSVSLFYNRSDESFRFGLPVAAGGDTCRASGVSTDEWRHLLAVWTGSEQKIYVDGQLAETLPTRKFLLDGKTVSQQTACIGRQAGARTRQNRVRALIDELAVFARALSEDEIHALYRLGLRGFHLQP